MVEYPVKETSHIKVQNKHIFSLECSYQFIATRGGWVMEGREWGVGLEKGKPWEFNLHYH